MAGIQNYCEKIFLFLNTQWKLQTKNSVGGNMGEEVKRSLLLAQTSLLYRLITSVYGDTLKEGNETYLTVKIVPW